MKILAQFFAVFAIAWQCNDLKIGNKCYREIVDDEELIPGNLKVLIFFENFCLFETNHDFLYKAVCWTKRNKLLKAIRLLEAIELFPVQMELLPIGKGFETFGS